MGGVSDRTPPAGAEGGDGPFGAYVDSGLRSTGLIGGAALVALGGGSAVLGLLGEVAWTDALLAVLMGLAGAAWIWSMTVRPRMEVSRRGVVVVNPVRTIEIPWAEVDSFDCHHSLAVCRTDGSSVAVAALPANGLRRILGGTPGRADRLAIELNAYVATSVRPGTAPARVSIETPEGRRDLRVLAGLALLCLAATATLRHLVG
jgi:hypothetical protein